MSGLWVSVVLCAGPETPATSWLRADAGWRRGGTGPIPDGLMRESPKRAQPQRVTLSRTGTGICLRCLSEKNRVVTVVPVATGDHGDLHVQ